MENINYSELAKNFMESLEPNFAVVAEKVEKNYSEGENNEGTIAVYVEELIDCHYGSYIPTEFCSWFGIVHDSNDDMESIMWDYDKLCEAYCNLITEQVKPLITELKGSCEFYIGSLEADGSLCLFCSVEQQQQLAFSTWRREQGYQSKDNFRSSELCNERDEEDIEAEWDSIVDEFDQYCEDYNYEAVYDED